LLRENSGPELFFFHSRYSIPSPPASLSGSRGNSVLARLDPPRSHTQNVCPDS